MSDKQEVLFEDVSPSTAFSIRKLVDELKMRIENAVDGETSSNKNFLFVAHFVSGTPLCPALHNIKMRVSSKKSFTLLKSIENAVDGETSSNKTSCLSLTSCLGNPCVPPFIISKCE